MAVAPAFSRERFDTEGYVVLRGLLEPDVVEAARREMEGLVEARAADLARRGKVPPHAFAAEPFDRRIALLYEHNLDEAPKLFRPELHLPGLYGLFFHPRLLDVVQSVLGPEIRLYPNYTARPKLPDWEGTRVLWHQDGGYTGEGAEALRMVNAWTALVPATVDNGCMQFVPGTHRLGAVPHVGREHYLEIAPEHLQPVLDRAVPVETTPADVVLFHNMLFHQGLPNRSGRVRWSLDWRYQDATQPTLRPERGHLARSRREPDRCVRSAEDWASRTFE